MRLLPRHSKVPAQLIPKPRRRVDCVFSRTAAVGLHRILLRIRKRIVTLSTVGLDSIIRDKLEPKCVAIIVFLTTAEDAIG